jgi:hypothetical protein
MDLPQMDILNPNVVPIMAPAGISAGKLIHITF